jgi:hypothetical protein
VLIFAPLVVNLLGFKINFMDTQSILSYGAFQQADFYFVEKRNMGFGEDTGDISPIYIPLNYILDMDATDTNSVKGSVV